jgi:hypothetical protein
LIIGDCMYIFQFVFYWHVIAYGKCGQLPKCCWFVLFFVFSRLRNLLTINCTIKFLNILLNSSIKVKQLSKFSNFIQLFLIQIEPISDLLQNIICQLQRLQYWIVFENWCKIELFVRDWIDVFAAFPTAHCVNYFSDADHLCNICLYLTDYFYYEYFTPIAEQKYFINMLK